MKTGPKKDNGSSRQAGEKSIALIGCGGWGKNLARNLAELNVLHSIVDPSPSAAALAEQFDVRHSDELRSALSNPDIRGFVIATPAETHVEIGLSALENGKHVYVEKPIALSKTEAVLLAQKASTLNRVLMVGHLLQYHPIYRELKAMADIGALGRIHHIQSDRMNLGLVRNEENVMWSFSPHDISMVLGLFAEHEVIRVRAHGLSFLQPAIEDIVSLQIEFDGGVTSEIRSSWVHPTKIQKLDVIGDKAIASFDDCAGWDTKLKIVDYTVDRSTPRPRAIKECERFVEVPFGEPLRLEMLHFLECIETNQKPLTDAFEAIRVLDVLHAAQKSLDGIGEWINV